MANAYATKLSEGFAARSIKYFYEKAVTPSITNQDYEGEIKDIRSVVNILTFAKATLQNYTGSNLVAADIEESVGQLTTDQQKAYYFKIRSLDRFKSWLKNPEGTIISQLGDTLNEAVDAHVLLKYTDAASGHWDGTSYTTGTVTIDAVTGAVTGNGTTFTAAMVGKPFKATGHTDWYRIKTYSSATSIVIEDDSDDLTSAYTGGAIAGGSTYVIQANTAVQVTKATLYTRLVALKTLLDKAKIPDTDRWCVMPADLVNLILTPDAANPLVVALESSRTENVKNGMVGRMAGFDIMRNEQVNGDSTDGFNVLAGHKSAITFAMGFVETGIEDLIGNFGKAYKGLNVYGSKVVDERRKALAHGFWKL